MTEADHGDRDIIGEAVLRDYPLRWWALQQQHTDEVLREFTLLLGGEQGRTGPDSAPAQLVDLAQTFSDNFGAVIAQLDAARQRAYDAGADRMDWHVPLPAATPRLMRQVQAVWAAVDEFCRSGHLLTLARPPELVALQAWATDELIAQCDGQEPTPWPGPW